MWISQETLLRVSPLNDKMNKDDYQKLPAFMSGASLLIRYPGKPVKRVKPGKVSYIRIEELGNGKSGFVFVPFDVSENLPVVLFEDLEIEEVCGHQDFVDLHSSECPYGSASVSYQQEFSAFHDAIVEGKFEKLVLARADEVLLDGEQFDLERTFFRLEALMPSACVYMLNLSNGNIWLGASPEVLVHSSPSETWTMALAGSVANNLSNTDPESFGTKNLEEHLVVVSYISSILERIGFPYTKSPIETVPAGKVRHLRSTFKIDEKLKEEQLAELVGLLHPTPAVAGLPKTDAIRFIKKNESLRRDYYAGFFGFWQVKGETSLYVNLRCSNIQYSYNDANLVGRIFAGGGIMPSSKCEEEWRETQLKQSAIRQVLSPYIK